MTTYVVYEDENLFTQLQLWAESKGFQDVKVVEKLSLPKPGDIILGASPIDLISPLLFCGCHFAFLGVAPSQTDGGKLGFALSSFLHIEELDNLPDTVKDVIFIGQSKDYGFSGDSFFMEKNIYNWSNISTVPPVRVIPSSTLIIGKSGIPDILTCWEGCLYMHNGAIYSIKPYGYRSVYQNPDGSEELGRIRPTADWAAQDAERIGARKLVEKVDI